MSEKEEYAAKTLFPDPLQLRCIAYRTVRQPTLHGSLMTHQAIANGQQMHNRHALQMNSVALWQNLDFELSEEEEKQEQEYDVEEEEEERQEQELEDVEGFASMLCFPLAFNQGTFTFILCLWRRNLFFIRLNDQVNFIFSMSPNRAIVIDYNRDQTPDLIPSMAWGLFSTLKTTKFLKWGRCFSFWEPYQVHFCHVDTFSLSYFYR